MSSFLTGLSLAFFIISLYFFYICHEGLEYNVKWIPAGHVRWRSDWRLKLLSYGSSANIRHHQPADPPWIWATPVALRRSPPPSRPTTGPTTHKRMDPLFRPFNGLPSLQAQCRIEPHPHVPSTSKRIVGGLLISTRYNNNRISMHRHWRRRLRKSVICFLSSMQSVPSAKQWRPKPTATHRPLIVFSSR